MTLADEDFANRLRAALAFGDKAIRTRVAQRLHMSPSSLNHWARSNPPTPINRRESLIRAIEDEGGLGAAFFAADLPRLGEIARPE